MDNYYVGIDAGTNSVGWAVTTPEYKIIKKSGKALWGSRLFDEASTAEKRRMARSSRRAGDRKAFRQSLLRELFSEEISKVDPAFYLRLDESKFWEEDKKTPSRFCIFADSDYTDIDYHRDYPTIYHLRNELMYSNAPHDVRLVYLAIAHLIKHRGHFFLQMSPNDSQPDFLTAWNVLREDALDLMGLHIECEDLESLQDTVSSTMPIRDKQKKLKALIHISGEPDMPEFKCLYDLVSGKTCDISSSFGIHLEGEEKNNLRLSFTGDDMDDEEKLISYHAYLDDKMQILLDMKAIYDWGILVNILHGAASISEGKVQSYNTHKNDLKLLQNVIKSECPDKYSEVFRVVEKNLNNYCAYTGHYDKRNSNYAKQAFRCSKDDFYKYIKGILKDCKSEDSQEILKKIDLGIFMPLQHAKDNSVIPYQMNLHELQLILKNASGYLPFLNCKDENGISVKEKIESLLTFRIPYYVGPLDNHNAKSGAHWAVKKNSETRVLPWNFDETVDKEASAEAFMNQLTNTCTYLTGESVLPKDSISYSHFMALNELNNVTVYGNRLPVQVKQKAFNELFLKKAQVTRKAFCVFLRSEGLIKKGEEDFVGGLDGDFKASLKVEQRLRTILSSVPLTEQQMDEIILSVLLLKQEPEMLRSRIRRIVPGISDSQLKQVCKLPCSGWGRLSARFLTQLKADLPGKPNHPQNILEALWNTQFNLMQILSNQMPYKALVDAWNDEMLEGAELNYETVEKLSAPPAVRRTVWQTVRIVDEITHIMGGSPSKIFVEMARGATGSGRTVSRKNQLLACYRSMGKEGNSWTEALDVYDDPRLRQDKLYLYFTQMGKCMYTGTSIDLAALLNDSGNQIYDIDHIYPRSKVKDDSMDNRVLVCKKANQDKGDVYPIQPEIRKQQAVFWKYLYDHNLISKIKLERLTRSTKFSEDELAGFISRQLVETRQSTKVLAQILEKALPDTRVVYVKAGNVSDFRQQFDLIKVRDMNDLHHAKDAYLNIVVGNVYDVKFTSDPRHFLHSGESYSMKPEVMYKHDVKRGNTVAWDHETSIAEVKKNYRRNNIMVTRLAQRRNSGQNGGFYDQNPVRGGTIPLKGDPRLTNTERYGGYNGDTGAYMFLVEHGTEKKRIRSLEPMYLRFADRVDKDPEYLDTYCREQLGLVNPHVIIPKILFNTLLDIKGFKFWLTGRSGTAQVVGIQAFQLVLAPEQEKYLKKVLRVCERLKDSRGELEVTEAHDRVSKAENLQMYDALLEKMKIPTYSVRPSSQVNTLISGRDIFKELTLKEQCTVLSNILALFRGNGKSDLSLIKGSKVAGTILFSKRTGNNLKIIYQSVTGFYSSVDERLKK